MLLLVTMNGRQHDMIKMSENYSTSFYEAVCEDIILEIKVKWPLMEGAEIYFIDYE